MEISLPKSHSEFELGFHASRIFNQNERLKIFPLTGFVKLQLFFIGVTKRCSLLTSLQTFEDFSNRTLKNATAEDYVDLPTNNYAISRRWLFVKDQLIGIP